MLDSSGDERSPIRPQKPSWVFGREYKHIEVQTEYQVDPNADLNDSLLMQGHIQSVPFSQRNSNNFSSIKSDL